jgi:hypothetical protein
MTFGDPVTTPGEILAGIDPVGRSTTGFGPRVDAARTSRAWSPMSVVRGIGAGQRGYTRMRVQLDRCS